MYVALGEALTRAESDPAVRVVLFEAEGDAFTAGNDIGDFAAVAAGTLHASEMKTHVFLEALARAQKPYVAAVQGLAVGVGVTMLMHCDLVVRRRRREALDAVRQSRARSGSRIELAAFRHASATRARMRCSRSASRSMASTAAAIGLANCGAARGGSSREGARRREGAGGEADRARCRRPRS